MRYSPQIVAELRAEMALRRYSVKRLAIVTGIEPSTLYRRLNPKPGGRVIDTDELAAVCAALDVPMSDLVARAAERAA